MHPDPDMHRVLLAASRLSLSETVRGYEMGQEGCLPASGFARYFEHMRWELGRRGRVPDEAMPKRGVVRAQTHVYGEPLRFPAAWTGRTHLVHVGGSSLHYGHDITLADGSVLVRARTVIVLLDASSRPARVPDYLRAYVDTGFDAPAPLEPSDASATPVDSAPTCSLVVRPSDQDSFGHVNQARYLDFLDDARRAAGLPRLRALSLSYARETLAGDTLHVHVGPPQSAGASPESARYPFWMVRGADGAVVNQGAFEA